MNTYFFFLFLFEGGVLIHRRAVWGFKKNKEVRIRSGIDEEDSFAKEVSFIAVIYKMLSI